MRTKCLNKVTEKPVITAYKHIYFQPRFLPGGLLCKSLGRGVSLGHWNPYHILVETMISLILQHYSRLGTKNPYPIPDLLFSMQNLYHYRSPTYAN